MTEKILARNLTARAAYAVAGNPASTRLESSVGNCFPGLEFDVRNLDRRFFPGLLFNYQGVPPNGVNGRQGARLVFIDTYLEPMLDGSGDDGWVQDLIDAYGGDVGGALGSGVWYLHFLEQDGRRIEVYEFVYYQNIVRRVAYEGETVWWLVRSLSPDRPLTIGLTQRDDQGAPTGAPIQLKGYRRRYVNTAGTFDPVYRPGEITASLCSPWTHDFRDCTCHYWASNHPDVTLGPVAPGTAIPDGSSTPVEATSYLDWLRRDTGVAGDAGAAATMDEARPFRYDSFEINWKWEQLPFVLERRQISTVYKGEQRPEAEPYDGPEALIDALENQLAPLELGLMIEYLYALFSLRDPEEVPTDRWPSLADDLRFARQFVTLVAVGEMMHLRWANQLLWELDHAGYFPAGKRYRPVVKLPEDMPTPDGPRPPALRTLVPEVLDEFVWIERPGGTVDTSYARAVATLKGPDYPDHLFEIAARIDTDGMHHYQRFRDIRRVFQGYAGAPESPYLYDMRIGSADETARALKTFQGIIENVINSFVLSGERMPAKAEKFVVRARRDMHKLNTEAQALASQGIGIPFLTGFPTKD